MIPSDFWLRHAEKSDENRLSALLGREYYVHRHLDWRPPIEWLGRQPFWLVEDEFRLLAALACPPDPPEVAWLRLFVTSNALGPSRAFRPLLEKCLEDLQALRQITLAAVGLQHWFIDLLSQNGFQHHQDVVVLSWDNHMPSPRSMPAGLAIRPMRADDLPQVALVDQESFEPLWQNSLDGVTLAFKQAAYASVAEQDSRILGFQVSTATPLATHLARLAVLPEAQRQNIGYALVYNLFSFFRRNGSWQLTVNTQNSNHASLALYHSLGFELTGDSFPVYIYPS